MKHRRASVLLACGLLAGMILPAAVANLDGFRRVMVLDQGRLKPLDTFARTLLQRLSGRTTFQGMDASAWLARALFTPGATLSDRVFQVNQPDVLAAIGINGAKRGRFSFSELRPGLVRLHELASRYARSGEESPGPFADEALRLFHAIATYYGLLDAFAFARPEGAITAIVPRAPALVPLAAAASEPWLSPAQALARGNDLPGTIRHEIEWLAQAAQAYNSGEQARFDRALNEFTRSVRGRLGPAAPRPARIALEVLYHRVAPFAKAGLGYGLALLLLLFSFLGRQRLMTRLSFLSLLIGFLVHTLGIVARMGITSRPPVTNLYETFVFVSWTAAAIGLLLARFRERETGLLAGGLAGLVFLVIAGRFAGQGDTMGMLTAVLDSNLWLAAHVVTIALGYAGCVVAGIFGHALLFQALLRRPCAVVARTAGSLYGALAFGLAFTTIGTLLGAIWADLSWGRFWGWDPKENGALLIIVWCAALLHARLAGRIGPIGIAAGGIGAIVCVALAWFGVNLLGLGLHAYGFTSGAARGLLAFTLVELAFIAVAVPLLRKKNTARSRLQGSPLPKVMK